MKGILDSPSQHQHKQTRLAPLPLFLTMPTSRRQKTPRHSTPSRFDRVCMKLVFDVLRPSKHRLLVVQLPDGTTAQFGSSTADPIILTVHDFRFFRRVAFGGDIGFGETYTDGLWSANDLVQVLEFFADNMPLIEDRKTLSGVVRRTFNRLMHLRNRNTRAQSRRNIRAHYDIGNDFFKTFLDRTMSYSCARYEKENDSLEQAQRNKIRDLISKADLRPGARVLEIGSGWGAFAVEAARTRGCSVLGITLSTEQLNLSKHRAKELGVDHLVEFRLCDYRQLLAEPQNRGRFDRIISIEMLEAVGFEHFRNFFDACDQLLAQNGIMLLQFINIPDQRFESYRKSCDWIQKYIFPGGLCPSLDSISHVLTRSTLLTIETLENIGPHYARTLREWRLRFLQNFETVRPLGFDDRFRRMWEYYLSYCEAGFATRTLGTLQVKLTRPNNSTLPVCPGYGQQGDKKQLQAEMNGSIH